MTFPLVLGWTGSFDEETGSLHLAAGDGSRAARVALPSPPADDPGSGLLGRVLEWLMSSVRSGSGAATAPARS